MFVILVFCLFTVTAVTAAEFGNCPSVQVFPDFDLEKFAGTWYEIESTPSYDQLKKKCSSYVVEYRGNKKAGLLHKYVSLLTGKSKSDYSDITTPNKNEPAKMMITPLKGTVLAKKRPLWILDTDYESYAISYSCNKAILTRFIEVYILARDKTLSDKQKMEIYNTLRARKVSTKNLMDITQDDKDCENM